MPDEKNKWFYGKIPVTLGSGDSAEKMCIDLCDTGAVCVRISAEWTPDSSLVEHSVLHCKGTVPAFGLFKPSPAW